ncbi:tetratricopeptide repeat protein [Aquabacterium sp.]|uniref:tetratricopeptide repeat protein n=1 Tax=Aquabacterium sp. TaxID=1872578 RepID=UPI0025BAE4C1|nr:tetratricopeptide repeat protein [Aquabacterium sp.]
MIDITLENFESDLIGGSMQVPILLDIWAEWCGPCKQLGPVLERLEEEYAGRFILAKVNADEQQEIAGQLSQMFGVRSIPFCVMFVGGQPVDGFVGALPAEKIREFLDKHVPGEGQIAAAEEVEQAEALLEAGEPASAEALLRDALEKDPSNDEARYELLQLLLEEGALEEAKAVFLPIAGRATGPLPEPRVLAFSRYLAACIAARQARAPQELDAAIQANKRDFAARFELAQIFWAAGQPTQAMEELLEIIMRDKAWNEELPRKTYVAILEVMSKPLPKPAPAKPAAPRAPGAAPEAPKLEIAGKVEVAPANPVIDSYRRKLSMALN